MATTSRARPGQARQSRRANDPAKAYHDLKEQPAQVPPGLLDSVEDAWSASSSNSVYRRLGMLMLTRTGKQLIEMAEGDRGQGEALADSVAGVESAAARLRALADMLDTSAARMTVALCVRDDALELLQAARNN